MRHLLSALPVEAGHELAVDLTGGFGFLGALGQGLLGAGEGLLELPGALGQVIGQDVLSQISAPGHPSMADDLAEAPAQAAGPDSSRRLRAFAFSGSARSEAVLTVALAVTAPACGPATCAARWAISARSSGWS